MVYFFSVKRNYPQVESLTQSELSTIEQIAAKSGIHVKIELIENGTIIYLDDTFPQDKFLKLKEIFFQNTKIQDPKDLPEKYGIWHDSVTGDTLYFAASGEEFLQFSLKVIGQFLSQGDGKDLMANIYKRVVKEKPGQKTNVVIKKGTGKKSP